MNWQLKKFSDLSPFDLYYVLKLRSAVFVVEQKCIYPDLDDKDQQALHVYSLEQNQAVAYARILMPGVSYQTPSIGRVAVDSAYRSKGLGKLVMKKAMDVCFEQYPNMDITISAQAYLEKFYQELGFITSSTPYLEDDIPHIKMLYRNN